MDLSNILSELREERDALDAAISALELWERERQVGLGHHLAIVTQPAPHGRPEPPS